MKKKLIRRILAVAVIATFLIGTMSFAQETDTEIPVEETQVIDADEIGIKTFEKEVATDEIIIPEAEDPAVDEMPVYVEDETPVYTESAETEKDNPEQEENEPVEEEDLDIPPEGMCEGYEAGVYLPVNSSCELHSECYRCEQCTYERTLSYDEDLGIYIGEETCIVCGHGTCVEITDENVEDYAPVADEEESEE